MYTDPFVIHFLEKINVDMFKKNSDHISGFEYILNNMGYETILKALCKLDFIIDLDINIANIRVWDNQNMDDLQKSQVISLLKSKYDESRIV
jgi:hypothetical protein